MEKLHSEAGEGALKSLKANRKETFLQDLDEQWPSLKFLGFGAYYAWIWLCYNSTLLFPRPDSAAVGIYDIYLASTTAVGFSLILCALFYRVAAPLLCRNTVIIAAGGIAAIGTLLTAWCSCNLDWAWSVWLMGALTGISTSFIALRLGVAYSVLPARRAVMYTASSFIFACMLYFVAVGLPFGWGLWFMAILPLLAAFMVSTSTAEDVGAYARQAPSRFARKDYSQNESVQNACQGAESGESVSSKQFAWEDRFAQPPMRHTFLARFVIGIGLYSLIVGITRAFPSHEGLAGVNEDGAVIVFLTAFIAVCLFVIMGCLNKRINIARLYSMAIVLTAAGILLIPVCEVLFFPGTGQFFESRAIGIAYALFVLTIWCLCAHLAHDTGTSAVRIFGLGRGSSALGTTLGWIIGDAIRGNVGDLSAVIIQVSILMGFVLFAVAMLVFNEDFISRAAAQDIEEDSPEALGVIDEAHGVEESREAEGADTPELHTPRRSWRDRCEFLVHLYGLSPREAEVLLLLGKGRTLDYIHNELGISMNTTKSHARNIYQKVGVHTRSELLDLIENVDKEKRDN